MDNPGSNKTTHRAALSAHVNTALDRCTKIQEMLLRLLMDAGIVLPTQTELSIHRINLGNNLVKDSIERIKTCVAEIDTDLK